MTVKLLKSILKWKLNLENTSMEMKLKLLG